jgi:hypothetical protein
VEWPHPLGEEGEKQEIDDPEKTNNPKVIRQRIIRERQGKVKTAKITAGKGCSESKWLAAKSATS